MTYLAVIAVAICVFTVVVVMTVMNGLVTDFVKKNHAFVGDCVVGTDSLIGFAWYEDFIAELKNTDYVLAATPVINTFGLVNSRSTTNNAALPLMGIDIDLHIKVTEFASALHYRLDEPTKAFVPLYDPNLPGCIIGIDLLVDRKSDGEYAHLDFLSRWSYSVTCFPLTAKGALTKMGTALTANSKVFHYSDNAHTGLAKVDSGMVYLPFDQLQQLCSMARPLKRATDIYIKFLHGSDIEECTAKVASAFSDFVNRYRDREQGWLFDTVTVKDWKSYRCDTIAPMEKEQTMMILLFIMVGIITVFIILVVFYMVISQKSKDIGILKSIGASAGNVTAVFLIFAGMIGIAGASVGIAFGMLFLTKINVIEDWLFVKFGWQLWNRQVYAIGDIPSESSFTLLTIVFAAAIIASLAGALLPVVRGASKNCVDVLRVNEL